MGRVQSTVGQVTLDILRKEVEEIEVVIVVGGARGSGSGSISTTGDCGSKNGKICKGFAKGECCSANGYYGSSSDHCAAGCQSSFGVCN
jgi:hypothetical protein